MKNHIICDECKKEFIFKINKIRVKNLGNGIEQHYLTCPYCKHKFIFMYKSEEIKKNLYEMECLKKIIARELKNKNDISKLFNEYEKLYNENLKLSEKYKQIHGK